MMCRLVGSKQRLEERIHSILIPQDRRTIFLQNFDILCTYESARCHNPTENNVSR